MPNSSVIFVRTEDMTYEMTYPRATQITESGVISGVNHLQSVEGLQGFDLILME